MKQPRKMRDWLWLAFSRHALIPLLLVETALVVAYIVSANSVTERNSNYLYETAIEELSYSANNYASHLDTKLGQISTDIRIFGDAVTHALKNTEYTPSAAEIARLRISDTQVLYNPSNHGGAAVFYPQPAPGLQRNMAHVYRMNAVEPLMQSLVRHHPLVEQVYFNQYDSFNYIYPYIDVIEQYPVGVDVNDFAFFYLANPQHNPSRQVRWTPVYLDPAGQGWLTTATYPIYLNDRFIGAVGFDITIRDLIAEVEAAQLPWEGFAMLVDEQRDVIALADSGAERIGLTALPTGFTDGQVMQERNQGSQHNLYSYPSFRPLVKALATQHGVQQYQLNDTTMMVGWATIANTQWKLLTLVDKDILFAQTQKLDAEMHQIVYWMMVGLLLFYLVFFLYVRRRAWAFSGVLETAATQLSQRIQEIEKGQYRARPPLQTELVEVNQLGQQIESMASVLHTLVERLSSNEQRLSIALQSYGDLVVDYRADEARICELAPLWHWLGYSGMPEQLRAIDFVKYIHADDAAHFDLAASLEAGEGFDAELRMRCRDERWLWLHMRSQGQTLEATAQHSQLVTVSNIEQRKQYEFRLKQAKELAVQANLAKSVFLSAVTSEIKAPLQKIEQTAEQHELDEIVQRSRYLQRLIDDILSQSEIDTGTVPVTMTAVQCSQVLEPALQWIKPIAADNQNEVMVLETQCSEVYADPRRLTQVLINLFFFAVKYNGQPGRIYVSCIDEGDSVQIIIRGEGQGREMKVGEALAHEAPAGLQFCREIAQRMRADLNVTQTSDKGTMFTLTLQRA